MRGKLNTDGSAAGSFTHPPTPARQGRGKGETCFYEIATGPCPYPNTGSAIARFA
ncbi:hypothetical protein GMST_26870 [Geomonas silvestris]|uniref:Uncharacterized protein n=1 Tax=Geomonas silvestris TaxID=2740184 RepID=A0A6V8MK76_9BACT|nr:hypothetical protein GMST_26870 [Geomonas silvestris]